MLQRFTSPPALTLTRRQPTPSTVCLTVSTRPAPQTLAAHLRHYVAPVLRFLVGALALLAVELKWALQAGRHGVLERMSRVDREMLPVQVLQRLPWSYVGPGVVVVLWLALRRGYTEESLLILSGLGLQTSTSSSTYLYSPMTRFIPTTSIQDIFIHEAFKGFEVRFYLAVVVKGEEDVVVVFPLLLPRREILEQVWRSARACLYDRGGGVPKDKAGV